ncbi:hypothetical protein ETH_00012020 [Eimeria tenella]|uniref:Uncharacterized protein n=1 Tax=Eimeria tenella TaxID=5802 RepID=U6L4N4_EIMTE|nr:hypothetical protein ETH_00012020 [Eimeria tenella]CDJ43549.1 hypothetical protein ETH_00012020 [Eimeria tenella]|eukprot:XP_013234299.1 hypothetical protein ETH_00012020 [Eimeria tenella]
MLAEDQNVPSANSEDVATPVSMNPIKGFGFRV